MIDGDDTVKKMLYIIVIFCCLLFKVNEVEGVTYKVYTNKLWSDGTSLKTYYKTIDGAPAYCANKYLYAPPGDYMDLVDEWEESTDCSYSYKVKKNGEVTTKKINGIQCSIMVGYLIDRARKAAKAENNKYTSTSEQSYIFVQKVVQTYLKKYGGKWAEKNVTFSAKMNNKSVSTIIKEAYDKYVDYKAKYDKVSAEFNNITNKPKIESSKYYDVSGNIKEDNNLYYSDSNGYYVSSGINITPQFGACPNGMSCDFSYKISVGTGARICKDTKTEWDDCKRVLDGTVSRTKIYIKTKSTSDIVLKVVSKVKEKKTATDIKYKNSEMYEYIYGPDRYQKLLIFTQNEEETKKASKTFTNKNEKVFKVVGVNVGNCSTLYSGYSTAVKQKKNIVCENNYVSGKNTTDAKFNYCSNQKKSISVNSGNYYYRDSSGEYLEVPSVAKVSISVGIDGKFHFGEALGDTYVENTNYIKKGQGFYLKNTYYTSSISWKFNSVYSSNNSVYVTSPKENIHHLSGIYVRRSANNYTPIGITYDVLLNQSLNNLSVGDDLSTNIGKEVFTLPVSLKAKNKVPASFIKKDGSSSLSTRISQNKKITDTYFLGAPTAFIKIADQSVSYQIDENKINEFKNNSAYNYAGNRFYTFLKYNKDDFEFYINSDKDFSPMSDVVWNIDGKCSVKLCPDSVCYNIITDDLNFGYRTVDLENPFPNGYFENWSKESDRKRLNNNIFNINPDYKVVLSDSSVSDFTKYNSTPYTSFKYINNDGKSSFVTDVFKGNIFAVQGINYCPYGSFSSSCDIKRN